MDLTSAAVSSLCVTPVGSRLGYRPFMTILPPVMPAPGSMPTSPWMTMSPSFIPPPIRAPAEPRITKSPPCIKAPASSPTPSMTLIFPLRIAYPEKSPAICSQTIVLPRLAAPRNAPVSPWIVKLPPLPKAAIHEPRTPRARIFEPVGKFGQSPSSPFFGTGSPALVQPMRSIASCLAASINLGPSFLLILKERSTTSRGSAMMIACCSISK